MRFDEKVAIVTGAGSGIGRATATRFASEGARLACVDLQIELAEETAKEISRRGGHATAHRADVSNAARVQEVVQEILAAHQTIDILINNAGIARDASAKKLTEQDWDLVLDVNLKGTFLFCQKVLPTLMEKNSGRIINTASIAMLGNFGQANYSASKAGVVGLTKTLALEVAKHGITVNCVAPGATNTTMVANIPDNVRQALIARIPLKRLAEPDDIAALHAFLASDDARYMTGQVLFCDGGLSVGA